MGRLREFFRHTRFVAFAFLCACILAVFAVLILSTPDRAETTYGEAYGESGQRKAIIETARYYLGTPYSTTDCSELTRLVYGEAIGVWMPSDYIAQREYGYPSPTLKRGDLLLYADGNAIYWGNGQALMSSHYYGYVEIIDMDDLYGYMGARRIQ